MTYGGQNVVRITLMRGGTSAVVFFKLTKTGPLYSLALQLH